jgi:hypothetical protein
MLHRLSRVLRSHLRPKGTHDPHSFFLGNLIWNLGRRGVHGGLAELPKPPPLSELLTEEDNADASAWVARFGGAIGKIPKELVELSFSRSSGPGGQVRAMSNIEVTFMHPS